MLKKTTSHGKLSNVYDENRCVMADIQKMLWPYILAMKFSSSLVLLLEQTGRSGRYKITFRIWAFYWFGAPPCFFLETYLLKIRPFQSTNMSTEWHQLGNISSSNGPNFPVIFTREGFDPQTKKKSKKKIGGYTIPNMTASHLHIHKKSSGKVDICMVNLVGTAFLYFHPEHLSHEWVEDFRHNDTTLRNPGVRGNWLHWETRSMVLLTNSGSHSSRGEIFLRRKMERGRMSLLYVTCFFGGLFSWRLLYQNAKKTFTNFIGCA